MSVNGWAAELKDRLKLDGVLTEHGFFFVNHTKKEGHKPHPGETVWAKSDTYIGDSLMASTSKIFGAPREYKLLPKDLPPARVPAVYDAFLLMTIGDSATVYQQIDTILRKYIPPELEAAREVRYEIVLVDFRTLAEEAKVKEETQARLPDIKRNMAKTLRKYKSKKGKRQLKTTASGLKLRIEEEGSGAAITAGERISIHYYGCLTNGTMFDNSYQRGTPFTFSAGTGQLISGFEEGIMLLHHGARAYFFIPASLGYGDQPAGQIPANSELVFYVEILVSG